MRHNNVFESQANLANKMRIYLTGSDGFVGRWFAQHIAKGAGAWSSCVLGADTRIDIRDAAKLKASLTDFCPDAVVHLAAQSNIPASIAAPAETASINVMGTLALLDAIEQAAPRARLLHVGSGDMYGLVDASALPIAESAPLMPRNPYAASKIAAEMFVRERAVRGRIDACCVRSFNHTGPGQTADFVLPALAMQIARFVVDGQRRGTVSAGDLDCSRDFLDVRDVIEAYRVILEKGTPGAVYNVCSGTEVALQDALENLSGLAGIAVEVRRDPSRLRPAEQKRVCGNPEKLQSLGWRRTIAFETTLRDLLADCRARLHMEMT